MSEPAMRLPDALALGSAMGWATFDVCDRMAARLVRVICEQDERITALGVRVLVRDDRIREAWDVVGRLESSRDELEAECDDLVGQIEGERLVNLTLNRLLTETRLERDNAIAERDAAHQEVAEVREQIARAIEAQTFSDQEFVLINGCPATRNERALLVSIRKMDASIARGADQ